MTQNEYKIKSYVQRISNILMTNGGFLDNPGLYTGEMGPVLFFFRYGRYTQNELFKEYAFKLTEKIQNSIPEDSPIDYKKGVTGICSTVEYLIQNGYFEGDSDDILGAFDDRLFSLQNLPRWSNEEVVSLAYYAIWRMSGNSSKKEVMRKTLLPEIVVIMEGWRTSQAFTCPIIDVLKEVVNSGENGVAISYQRPSSHPLFCNDNPFVSRLQNSAQFMERILKDDFFKSNKLDFGFPEGLAAIGMELLTMLDGDTSWTALFPNHFT